MPTAPLLAYTPPLHETERKYASLAVTKSSWRRRVLEEVGGFDAAVDALLDNLGLVVIGSPMAAHGVVIRGSPGSGKSHLAISVASAVAPLGVTIVPADLAAAAAGAEGAIAALQDALATATCLARNARYGSSAIVVVFERAEALIPGEDETSGAFSAWLSPRVVVEDLIVTELRRWCHESLPASALMPWAAATSVPAMLCGTGAFVSRITLPTPLGRAQRRMVLAACTRNFKLSRDGDLLLDDMADATAGFLPCDLDALCRAAALAAVHRSAVACNDLSGCSDDSVQIVAEDFACACRRIDPTPRRGAVSAARTHSQAAALALETRGDEGFAAVVGQRAAVDALRARVVHPFNSVVAEHSILSTPEPPIGVLLEGPPGSGKTYLAGQLAVELRAHVFSATPADVLAPRVGDAEKRMASLFAAARQCAPSIVILEDVDALAPNLASLSGPAVATDSGGDAAHSTSEEYSETRVAYALRAELDLLNARRKAHAKLRAGSNVCSLASEALVVVTATTCDSRNMAGWLLSPHRLSVAVQLEPRLSPSDAAELLRRRLCGQGPVMTDINEFSTTLSASGKNNGAAISGLCRIASACAVRRAVSAYVSDISITLEDLHTALSMS